MADNIETFGFEKEDIRGGIYDKYKAKKGEIHRLGILYTDPKSMFAGAKVHFNTRFFLCKKGLCCEKCGVAKWRVGSVIIKYATDRQGMVKQPFSYELLPWMFSETNFGKLKSLNADFPLATHDIKVSCTNDEYQHLDITPCTESIWGAKEAVKNQILLEAKPIWDYVKRSIASDLSLEEIKDLLGLATTAGSDPTSKLDLDKVLDTV